MRPRVERRDVHAVAVEALDAVIEDRAERRPDDDLRIARGDPAERRHLHAAAERLEPVSRSAVTATPATWCTIQRRPVMSNSLLTAS